MYEYVTCDYKFTVASSVYTSDETKTKRNNDKRI